MDERDPDPYKLCTVMRRSLNLRGGKIGAQCQHAYTYLAREVKRITKLMYTGDHANEALGRLTTFCS